MIRGKKVILRTLRESDLKEYFELTSDLANMSSFWPANLQSENTLRKEFQENGFWKEDYRLLLITDKQGKLIGEVDAFRTSPNIQGSEAGYRLFRKEDMGKGYASEALLLFSAYLYQTRPQMIRLTLLIRADNLASTKVAQKCGYKHEGTLRQAWIDCGIPYEMEVYSLLRDECPKLEDIMADE